MRTAIQNEFTIITVCRNARATILDCLNSVASQSVPVQHIVMDGASTDGTAQIVREFNHSRVTLISEPDGGIYDAMNKGIRLATGNVIGILNSDDVYAYDRVLEDVSQALHPSVQGVYGNLVYVSRTDLFRVVRTWRAGPYNPKRFYLGWMPPHPTLFLRKEVYDERGLYRTDHGTAADYEFVIRALFKPSVSLSYLNKVLVKMRIGGASNRSLAARWKATRLDALAWKRNGVRPYLWTIPLKPLSKLFQLLPFAHASDVE